MSLVSQKNSGGTRTLCAPLNTGSLAIQSLYPWAVWARERASALCSCTPGRCTICKSTSNCAEYRKISLAQCCMNGSRERPDCTAMQALLLSHATCTFFPRHCLPHTLSATVTFKSSKCAMVCPMFSIPSGNSVRHRSVCRCMPRTRSGTRLTLGGPGTPPPPLSVPVRRCSAVINLRKT